MADIDKVYNRRELETAFGFSQSVRAGPFLFLSGCVSWDADGNPLHVGDLEGQVDAIYTEIEATLKVSGLDPNDIVKETVFCRDIDALMATNARRLQFYQRTTPPASTWVQVERLAHPDLLLEVEVIAFINR